MPTPLTITLTINGEARPVAVADDTEPLLYVPGNDRGQIINPDGLRSQIEGNVRQEISRTLHEEVTFDQHGVTSVIWAANRFLPGQLAYSVLNFVDVPSVEIVLLDRPAEVPWGAGEPVIGAIGSAIGNASSARPGSAFARSRSLRIVSRQGSLSFS